MNEKIKTAVLVLITIIIIYTILYTTLFYIDKNNFRGAHTFVDVLYFTITTQTTVGYGDITPKSQLAKFAVICQCLTSLLFVLYLYIS